MGLTRCDFERPHPILPGIPKQSLRTRKVGAYGWIPLTRHDARGIVACWRLKTIGPFQSSLFGTLHLHGRHYPLPLLLACFRTYASSNLLPAYLQGSIPGLWLAVTGAGFTPARICDIALPQLRPDPVCIDSMLDLIHLINMRN